MVRVVWVGGGLLAASVGCAALTLGPLQGHAYIGRPLDVSVPLNLREGELLAEGCVSAQVFFAEQARPFAGVTTTLVTGPGKWDAVARVQTSQALPETFVRVELRAGCGHGVSRAYALLVDPAPVLGVVTPPSSPVAAVALPDLPLPTPANPVLLVPKRKPAPTPMGKPQPVVAEAGRLAVSPPVPRVEWDPVVLVAEQGLAPPPLRLSAEMSGVSEFADPQLVQNREMVRLLWKALSDSPEQSAATALVTQAREAEIHRLKAALAAAPPRGAADPRASPPENPTGGHDLAVFAGGLLTLAVAMGGLMAVLRRQQARRKEQLPWWENPSVFPVVENTPLPTQPRAGLWARLKAKTTMRSKSQVPEAVAYPLDIDLDAFPEKAVTPAPPASDKALSDRGVTPAVTDFTHSALFDNPRSVATEELFDMQQQVEFFISLGQSDQAIEVLQAHLSGSDGDSPLIYLDLLKLYHEQGRRKDYTLLQQRFNGTFNGRAPDFDGYSTSRRGLERYGRTLKAIQALWPQPSVVELIERLILRNTPGDLPEVFDLEAYRELLLLYGIAREVIDGHGANSRFPSATEPFGKLRLPPDFFKSGEPLPAVLASNGDALDLDFFGVEGAEGVFTLKKAGQNG